MTSQISNRKRKITTNYSYSRRNLIDRKLNKYFIKDKNRNLLIGFEESPLILNLDIIYREINKELKIEHEKTITIRTLFLYIKRKIIRDGIYCIIFRINKKTNKWEIYYEYKPEARSILTEEQLMKLDNELSKDQRKE